MDSIDGRIHGNSINPGKELAVALKSLQLEEGPDKSLLNHLFRFLRRTGDLDHRCKEAILVLLYECRERSMIALDGKIDQLTFFTHDMPLWVK